MTEINTLQQHGLHQAFQYLSLSANNIFNRKKPLHCESLQEQPYTTTTTGFFDKLRSRSNSNISSVSSNISGTTTASEQEESTHDTLSPIPTPSTSTTLSTPIKEELPWKLQSNSYSLKSDYFHVDRDEKQHSLILQNIERDSYGFQRPTQWVQIKHLRQFDIYYQPILEKQLKGWNEMLNQHNQLWPQANDVKFIKNVRQGIPIEYRGQAWMYYSGARAKMEANPELYESLVNTAVLMGEHNEYAEIIQRDLHRTFPDNSKFACEYITHSNGSISMKEPDTNTELQSLRRILLAFSCYSPNIGYCQSLNYLAGFFLLFTSCEKEAFWMLVTTVHDYMPENMYDQTMEGANMDQSVLLSLVQEFLPRELSSKIVPSLPSSEKSSSTLPPVTLVTSHWFLTMFINILPVETVLRIWDCFFIEGYSVMFHVALTIIKMNGERISDIKDPIEIFQILQNMPRRVIDCHQFMENVFSTSNSFAKINMRHIEQKRRHFKLQRKY